MICGFSARFGYTLSGGERGGGRVLSDTRYFGFSISATTGRSVLCRLTNKNEPNKSNDRVHLFWGTLRKTIEIKNKNVVSCDLA